MHWRPLRPSLINCHTDNRASFAHTTEDIAEGTRRYNPTPTPTPIPDTTKELEKMGVYNPFIMDILWVKVIDLRAFNEWSFDKFWHFPSLHMPPIFFTRESQSKNGVQITSIRRYGGGGLACDVISDPARTPNLKTVFLEKVWRYLMAVGGSKDYHKYFLKISALLQKLCWHHDDVIISAPKPPMSLFSLTATPNFEWKEIETWLPLIL